MISLIQYNVMIPYDNLKNGLVSINIENHLFALELMVCMYVFGHVAKFTMQTTD